MQGEGALNKGELNSVQPKGDTEADESHIENVTIIKRIQKKYFLDKKIVLSWMNVHIFY